MGRFARRGVKTVLILEGVENDLMPNLVQQLLDVLEHDSEGVTPTTDEAPDPFARWEASFSQTETIETEDFGEPDPFMARLFPNPYPDDPEAAHDFRRFTQADERRQKIAECHTVLDDLSRISRGRVEIPADHLGAWLKTINNLRLVLSVVLGITDEVSSDEVAMLPDDDPKAVVHHYYAWLGWMLETLIEALDAPA